MDPLKNIDLTGCDDNEPSPLKKDVPEDDPRNRCPRCLDQLQNAVAMMCGHVFCRKCLEAFLRYTCRCPICRKNVYGDSP